MMRDGMLYTLTTWTAKCERCGVPHPDGMKDTPAEASRAANASDWVVVRGQWICNTCAPRKEPSRGP